MAVKCPGCGKQYDDGVTMCVECGTFFQNASNDSGAVDNSDAISKMFKAAKIKTGSETNAVDRIPKDALEGFNKGEAVDISLTGGNKLENPNDIDMLLSSLSDVQFDDQIYEKHFGEQEVEEKETEPEGIPIKIAESNPDVFYEMPGSEAEARANAAAYQAEIGESEESEEIAKPSKKKEKKQKIKKQPKLKKNKKKADKNIDDTNVDQNVNPDIVMLNISDDQSANHDTNFSEPAETSFAVMDKPMRIKLIAIMVLSVFISLTIGGTAIYLYIDSTYKNSVYDIAYESVNDIARRLPATSRFIVYDVYVKVNKTSFECVINGVVSVRPGEYEPTYYRVVSDNVEKKTIYNPFNKQEYDRLMAGDEQDRISADIMHNYYQSYLISMDQINNGTNNWKKVNADYINMQRLG